MSVSISRNLNVSDQPRRAYLVVMIACQVIRASAVTSLETRAGVMTGII